MGRPREHDNTVRLALLEAAERLVDEQGAAALSARNVADAAATTTRAVYSVFGSMTGLLEALATRLFELLDEALDAVVLTDDPVADVIHASIDGFRRVALAHAPLYNLVFLRVVPDLTLGPEFHAVANATFGRLESFVKRLAPSGRRRPTTPELTRTVHALTEGLATWSYAARSVPQQKPSTSGEPRSPRYSQALPPPAPPTITRFDPNVGNEIAVWP